MKDRTQDFEPIKSNTIPRREDKITVTEHHQIYFPIIFCKRNNLSNIKCVLLYFDNTTNEIAIEFLENEDERGFKYYAANGGKSGTISARRFFNNIGLLEKIRPGRYNYSQKIVDGRIMFVSQLSPNRK